MRVFISFVEFKILKLILDLLTKTQTDWSPVFAAMINQIVWKECKTKKLLISNFTVAAVKELIAFLYLGKLESWKSYSDWRMMSQLLLLGDKYNLPQLMDLAVEAYTAQWLDEKFQAQPTLDWFRATCLLDSHAILKKSALFIQP